MFKDLRDLKVPNADSGISSVSWLKGKGCISPEVARGTQTLKKGLFNESRIQLVSTTGGLIPENS